MLLFADEPLAELLEQYGAWLPALLIVSQVEFGGMLESAPADSVRFESLPQLATAVRHAAGTKCERCWNYSVRVGESSSYPTICERCVAVLAEMDNEASAGVGSTV